MKKDNTLKKLGGLIRTIRQEKDLSQEELASIARLHRTYIGMVERGEKNVTIISLIRILNALNVEIYDFFKRLYES